MVVYGHFYMYCIFTLTSVLSRPDVRANLLALLYMMFSCVFDTFQCGVLGQVWYLIISIPDLCLLPYVFNTGISN